MIVRAKTIKNLIAALAITVLSCPAKADDTWLDWFNRGMFSFNSGISDTLSGIADVLPSLPPAVAHGMRNFAVTWVSEPLNAGAHLIAGRPDDAGSLCIGWSLMSQEDGWVS